MIIVSCILCSFCSFAKNETINQPSEQDAVLAIGTLMALPDNLISIASAKIGTCVPAINAKNEGQIACTTVIVIGGSSSENQIDFYFKDGNWVAEPSESQGLLPFPDPKLQ